MIANVQSLQQSRPVQPLALEYEPDQRAVWAWMTAAPAPIMSPNMLLDMARNIAGLDARGLSWGDAAETQPVEYVVIGSAVPGTFNLGGDLALVRDCVVRGDRTALSRYARQCVDVLFAWATSWTGRATTISLVQGTALGGGFECALASNVLVAEKGVRFGFPEVLFNMFPGMGAYAFLSRRIGMVETEKLIRSGIQYTAEELHDMGVVDVLAEPLQGEFAVAELIARRRGRSAAHRAIDRVRARSLPVDHAELVDVAEIWVESALALTPADLRNIDRLLLRQRDTGRTPARAAAALG